MLPLDTVTDEGYSSGTVTDSSEFFRHLFPGPFKGCRIDAERESEDGTCTMAIKVYYRDPITDDRVALLDQAGNQIVFNDWANGETDRRFIQIHPSDMLGDDADGVLAVGNNTYFRQSLPTELELEVAHGGTSVENVYNLSVTWLH